MCTADLSKTATDSSRVLDLQHSGLFCFVIKTHESFYIIEQCVFWGKKRDFAISLLDAGADSVSKIPIISSRVKL